MMLDRHLAPIARRLRNLVTRAVVALVEDTERVQRLQVQALKDEVLEHLEHWLPYGLTTHAPSGCEALLLSLGGAREQAIVVAVADRRYRLTGLEAGDVALYDDLGQVVRLGRTGIVIEAAQGVIINGQVIINGDLAVNGIGGGAGTMTLKANINLTGNINQSGNINQTGSLASSGAVAGSTLAMGGQTLSTAGAGAVVRVLV